MSRTDDRYHDALAQIAEIARAACAAPAAQSVPARNGTAVADFGCVVKRMPARLAARAARHAIGGNYFEFYDQVYLHWPGRNHPPDLRSLQAAADFALRKSSGMVGRPR